MLVQKLRLQRGWSQQQLAELSGLNVRTIQRIEKGQEPSVESLKSLAGGFNGSLWVGVLVCFFTGLKFPSGLACLDPSGKKNKWKSVWDENFKIDA